MADSKQGESFFRKVVRFVANPATDWTEITTKQEDNKELELEKSELKAMIERKRRNDFVRKREFDMLRKLRREGLSPEQLAALAGSSRLDDGESRPGHDSRVARADLDVKGKIDEIEQQMVGGPDSLPNPRNPPPRRSGNKSTSVSPLATTMPAQLDDNDEIVGHVVDDTDGLPAMAPLPDVDLSVPAVPPKPAGAAPAARNTAAAAVAVAAHEVDDCSGMEVNEVVHDPELDEAVIAFANADFNAAEAALQALTGPGGSRWQNAETWLVLFDLYRATGQQLRFESLALDYAHQFGLSAPQWYSLPQLVADAAADDRPHGGNRIGGQVSWVCPERLDTDAVSQLRAMTLHTPLPWVFEWGALRHMEPEAAMQVSTLFRLWGAQTLDMRWLGGEQLLAVLREAAPTGVRDADPVYWLTRMDALRLANRPDQFDEAAIDYCVTYEVSPPSWEPARCKVHISEGSGNTSRMTSVMPSEASTSFLESGLNEELDGAVANVELNGQLVGDIDKTLRQLSARLGNAAVVNVSCARLIRVDFIAAGDLLNWVIHTSGEDGSDPAAVVPRSVHFIDAHRLVALFFGAMGINERARVLVRRV